MQRLKLIWFALAGTFFIALLFSLIIIESVPLFIYFLITGEQSGWSEKITKATFNFIEKRFETISEYSLEEEA
jgi:hypothetical protein